MINIRIATINDLPQLCELFNSYRIFYRKDSDAEGAKNFLQERMENNESTIVVAEEENKLIGFTQCYPLFSSVRMKKILLLNDLFVLEKYRSIGISKQLIEAAKQLTRNTKASCLLLETEKTNNIGNKLYPSCGFILNDGSNFYAWENIF
jgi:ribosomal protein S18 acetylase RimI-like enzyme